MFETMTNQRIEGVVSGKAGAESAAPDDLAFDIAGCR
jgi:hypothetical protein